MHLHVAVNGKAQIDNNTLYDLYAVIERNRESDCTLPRSTLMGQLLDTVANYLRTANVFEACFADGTTVFFTGRMPPGVCTEAALKAAGFRAESLRKW